MMLRLIKPKQQLAQSAADVEFQAFLSRWKMKPLPACPAGMALLKDFFDYNPKTFELARIRYFRDTLLLQQDRRWRSFCEHFVSCDACQVRSAVAVTRSRIRK